MLYETIIKKKDAAITAKSIGDLVKQFDVGWNEFLIERFGRFPADDKYEVVYDECSVIYFNDNYFVYVFHGVSVNPVDSPEYTFVLDLRHQTVYYIGHSNVGNYVTRYDWDGTLLSEEDYGLKTVDLDKFINNYLMEYPCKNIKELLSTFNVDIKLSDKLLNLSIDPTFGTVFNYYYIQKGKKSTYHVFPGYFTEEVYDVHPPTICIDSANDVVYFRWDTMCGVDLNKYDSKDNEIELTESNFDLYGEYDLEKLLDTL